MHATTEDLTVLLQDEAGTDVRSIDFDEMAANINRFAPGTDLGPLLAQLPGGDCSVPHWGYVIDGAFTVHYSDGQQETITAGQLFYMQPHHDRLTTIDGVVLAEFSPAADARQLFGHIASIMQAAG
ncbi:MAG: hypothetical protein WBL35_09375 [Ornithinibacter sp.]